MTMENKIPLFSLLIPTRNRAHLLRYALESVLMQDWDDYEVIISDDLSTDQTREVVACYDDARLRYVRPSSYLVVHDHWNFAIQHCRGRYIWILGDDDCLVQGALRTFADLIRSTAATVVGCKGVDYFAPDYWAEGQRNTILVGRFTGTLLRPDVDSILADCFQLRFPPVYPRVQTAVISKNIIDVIIGKLGRFFEQPFPEYVAFPMALALSGNYLFLDKPLVVVGRAFDSLGPKTFWANLDPSWSESGSKLFKYVPLNGKYWTNGVAECMLRAKHNLPEQFRRLVLSPRVYYANYHRDMMLHQRLGRDIRHDLEEYERATESLPSGLRKQICIDTEPRLFVKLVRTVLEDSTEIPTRAKSRVAFILKPLLAKSTRTLTGESVGVTDILSCAAWVGAGKADRLF